MAPKKKTKTLKSLLNNNSSITLPPSSTQYFPHPPGNEQASTLAQHASQLPRSTLGVRGSGLVESEQASVPTINEQASQPPGLAHGQARETTFTQSAEHTSSSIEPSSQSSAPTHGRCQPSTFTQEGLPPSSSTQEGGHSHTEDINDYIDPEDRHVTTIDINGNKKQRILNSINDIWHLPQDELIEMDLNAMSHPMNLKSSKVRRFAGKLVRDRQLAPINFSDWRLVPQHFKDTMWDIIKSKFMVPNDKLEGFHSFIERDMGKKWKDYKHELKKMLLKANDTSAATVVARADPNKVNLSQLADLATTWFDEKWKAKSEKNKECRGKQKVVHSTGSKSYTRYASEWEKRTGALPSRAQLFVNTHKRKDGTHLNNETEKRVTEMEDLLTHDPTSRLGGTGGTMTWATDDIYSKVMGPECHGRVRGLGFGQTTKKGCNTHSRSTSTSNDISQISKIQSVVEMMQNELTMFKNMFYDYIQAQIEGRDPLEGISPNELQKLLTPNQSGTIHNENGENRNGDAEDRNEDEEEVEEDDDDNDNEGDDMDDEDEYD